MKTNLPTLAALALALLSVPALPVRALDSLDGRTLSLSDAVRLMLDHNLDLQVQDESPLIAQDALIRAQAAFDPSVSLQIGRELNDRQQNAIEFVSTGGIVAQQSRFKEQNWRSSVGLGGQLATGAHYEFSATLDVLDNSINRDSPTSLFSPEYQTFAGVSLTQPLLQGFGPTAALAEVRIARRELNVSELKRELELNNKLIEVTNAYYDLVFGQENLRVKLEAEKLAERLLDENRKRAEVGRMSPLDVSQAEVQVSEASEEVILARDFLREHQVTLLKLVLPSFDGATLPDFSVAAAFSTDEPTATPETLIASALKNRADYLLAEEQLDEAGLRRGQTRNATLPKLDLKFSYGLNGLSGSTDTSFRHVTDANEPSWAVGFALNIPLGNRAARADARSATRALGQAKLQLQQVELNLKLDIHNAVQRRALQEERLRTAATSRRVAEAALDAELQRLEAGQTTSFNVLQLQDKASAARTRELAARVDLEKTLAEVAAASGRLFERTGFTFARRTGPKSADSFSILHSLSRE